MTEGAAAPPKTRWRWIEAQGRRLVVGVPYLWLGLFFLVPFVIVLKISFAEAVVAQPPFTALVEVKDGVVSLALNLKGYVFIVTDPLYAKAYLNSVELAAIATLLTLIIGYPMAYGIVRAGPRWRNILLFLVVLPFWTSFLIRVYAWIGLLRANGLINNALMGLGLIDQPLALLNTNGAVIVGIVYTYLPFMVLPLYATLERLDRSLLEAAADLGARPFAAFRQVTWPLSLPGVIAGSMLVFIPAVGEFVIPALLGGPDTLMIGSVLWNEFSVNRDWPVASAVAIVLLALLVIPIVWFQRLQAREERL